MFGFGKKESALFTFGAFPNPKARQIQVALISEFYDLGFTLSVELTDSKDVGKSYVKIYGKPDDATHTEAIRQISNTIVSKF